MWNINLQWFFLIHYCCPRYLSWYIYSVFHGSNCVYIAEFCFHFNCTLFRAENFILCSVGLALPCGLLILALAEQVYWKLIGLGIASVGYSMSEMTVLGLTSFYREVALTAFSAGTGVGYVITPFYYTGKIWLHYYSFKICRRFWLAPISRVIFHNQLRAYHFWNWLETRLLRPQTIVKPPKSCLFTSGLKKMALTAIRGRNSWFLTKSERKKYKNRQRMLSTCTSAFNPLLITSSVLHLHHSWNLTNPH